MKIVYCLAVTTIIEGLSSSLVKLRLPNYIEFTSILGLSSIPSLRYLWFRQHEVPHKLSENEKGALKSNFPNMKINDGFLEIAKPDQSKNPMQGFWEIDCKQALFSYPFIGCLELGFSVAHQNSRQNIESEHTTVYILGVPMPYLL